MSIRVRRPAFAALPAIAFLAALAWSVSLFAAPHMLPAGSVTDLGGQENRVDHAGLWLDLPAAPGLLYAVGDLLCHQLPERTVHLNGNQVPVASRMMGIFLAATVGLGVAARPGLERTTWYLGTGVLEALGVPARWWPSSQRARTLVVLAGVALLLAPATLEVLAQAFTSFRSTIPRRLVTGALAGLAGGLVLGVGLRVFESVGWEALARWRAHPER